MSTTQRVSDEVWRSVPEKKLPAGRVWAAVGLVMVLLVAGIWASRAGLVVPQLVVQSSGTSSEADSGQFTYRFDLTNEGTADVVVSGIRLDAGWLTIVAADRGRAPSNEIVPGTFDLPFTVPAGATVPVRILVAVDCDARTGQGVPVVLEASARFGTHDVEHVPMPMAPLVDSDSLDPQPWPVAQSDWVCTPYTGETVDE